MAKRKTKSRGLSKKKPSQTFELTRVKLLYGMSGVFTLAVAALLMARPAPLNGNPNGTPLAAQSQDQLDSAITIDRGIDTSIWKSIVVDRTDSFGSASFHFAILPQDSGDQIAISSEWSRQIGFGEAAGELRIVLVSADDTRSPQEEKTIRLLVERLRDRLRITSADVVWR